MSPFRWLLHLETLFLCRETAASVDVGVPAEECWRLVRSASWRDSVRSRVNIELDGDAVVLRYPAEVGSFRQEAGWRSDQISFRGQFAERDGRSLLVGRFVSYWPLRVVWLLVASIFFVGSFAILSIGVWKITVGEATLSPSNLPLFAGAIIGPILFAALMRWDSRGFEARKVQFRSQLDRLAELIQTAKVAG